MMKPWLMLLMAAAMVCIPASAKSKKKAPVSKLKKVYYRISGGMEPYDAALVNLRREKDGRRLLTMKADCPGETLTFEVDDTVFQHCDSLIKATKVYEAKGFYDWDPRFVLLDAPSVTFDVSYTDRSEDFYASGDIPVDIHNDMSAVTDYLKSLRGNRQAAGHLMVLRPNFSAIPQATWTNGEVKFTPDEKGVQELYEFLAGELGIAYDYGEWDYRFAQGSGFSALYIINEAHSFMDAFIDTQTVGHTILTDDSLPGKWPQASQHLLTRKELLAYDNDTLQLISAEIHARLGNLLHDEKVQAYFMKQPWYEKAYMFKQYPSDLERQNTEMINRLISWRRKHQ